MGDARAGDEEGNGDTIKIMDHGDQGFPSVGLKENQKIQLP